jgi:uncharacterized protein involved in response to NO
MLFVIGRLAVAFSAPLGPVAMVVDLAFPLSLLAALAREIIVGRNWRNWRNMPMLGALAMLAVANLLTHLEAHGWAETAGLGLRLAVAVFVALITLIGGRIIPSFTRNWLAKRGATRFPSPFGRFDAASLAVSTTALVVWAVFPEAQVVPVLMAGAAVMTLIRLARWQGHRTGAEPLVWVLHLGFLWIPIGFALIALAALGSDPAPSAALHALTGGAIATMVLAVSTRATLGHTGRQLHADGRTVAIYALATIAAVARVAAGFDTAPTSSLLSISGIFWTLAFALFLAVYGRMLLGGTGARQP